MNGVLDHYDRFPALMDLFCGTGVNFEPLLAGIEATGRLVGVNGSAGMLARAHTALLEGRDSRRTHFPLHFSKRVVASGTRP